MEISLEKISKLVGGVVSGDPATLIRGINSLDDAGPGEISFLTHRRYLDKLVSTKASAILVPEETPLFKGPQVVVNNPGLACARVAGIFAPAAAVSGEVSTAAFVSDTCRLGKDVSIFPSAYIGDKAEIGDRVILYPGTFVGDRVRIGNGSVLYPNVTVLQDCIIGANVIIHSGTVIGSDGFGYVRDGTTSVKVPQIGIVQVDDDVEIGANSCIDRAALGRTWIKRGVKIDNLVQVAHNVTIEEDTVIVAQVGISGSVRIGRQVILGGQVGISDHVEIGDGAMIGSQSGIAKSVSSGEVVSGSPAIPHRLWLKVSGLVARLPQFRERLRDIEKRIEKLEMPRD